MQGFCRGSLFVWGLLLVHPVGNRHGYRHFVCEADARSDERPGKAELEVQPATDVVVKEEQAVASTGRAERRKSTSSSSLSAWSKALPRAVLVPSVKWDEEVIEKQQQHLSAFAPPFLQTPIMVDGTGQLVTEDVPLPRAVETVTRPEEVAPILRASGPPKVSAWAKGPPLGLKKVTIAEHEPSKSPSHLAPPPSAFSLFGTESDPATPWDPALRRQKVEDARASRSGVCQPRLLHCGVRATASPPDRVSRTALLADVSLGDADVPFVHAGLWAKPHADDTGWTGCDVDAVGMGGARCRDETCAEGGRGEDDACGCAEAAAQELLQE